MEDKKIVSKYTKDKSKWQNKAKKYANADQFKVLAAKTKDKINSGNKKFTNSFNTITQFTKMIHDFFKNDFLLGKKELMMMLGGLVYFISPIDIVPDFIPFAGLLDDFTVIAFIANQLTGTIDNYEEYVNEDLKKDYIDVDVEEL